jgi:hypothetical protein
MGKRRQRGNFGIKPNPNITEYIRGDYPEELRLKCILLSRSIPPGRRQCLVCGRERGLMSSMLWVASRCLAVDYQVKKGDIQHYWLCKACQEQEPSQQQIDQRIAQRQKSERKGGKKR